MNKLWISCILTFYYRNPRYELHIFLKAPGIVFGELSITQVNVLKAWGIKELQEAMEVVDRSGQAEIFKRVGKLAGNCFLVRMGKLFKRQMA